MTGHTGSINSYIENEGSTLLLAPAHSDSDNEACMDLLTDIEPENENVLSVAVGPSPDERLMLWKREAGDQLPKRATIIDASGQTSTASGTAASDEIPSLTVKALPGNAEPVDIGMSIARCLGSWESNAESSVVCLHSVTDLLERYEQDRVIGLVNGIVDLCDSVGASCHHHMDPGAHAEAVVARFRPLYDTVVEPGPDGGWTISDDASDLSPTFRGSTATSGAGTATGDGHETVPIPYSFDEMLDLISNARRRATLYYLKDQVDGTISLDDLAERVREMKSTMPGTSSSASTQDVKISLAHAHLPKLDTAGIVGYDPDDSTVKYMANPALESCLDHAERLELG